MQEIIELTKKLIEFETIKDKPEKIRDCLEFIKEYFSSKDFVVKEMQQNGNFSLFITYRNTKNPEIIFSGHIDVVPGEPEQFKPKVNGNKLYGRGASDMKVGIAAMMVLMKHFKDKKPDIGLMMTSDEETGGSDGAGYLVNKGFTAKFAIAFEPNYTDDFKQLNLTVSHKGIVWLKIKTKGKSSHGSRPWLGENAIEKLVEKYEIIKKMFPKASEKDGWKETINLGKISGGDAPNKVPDKAEMILDIRYTEKTTADEIIEKIKNIKDIEVEIIEAEPMLKELKSEYISKLKELIEKHTGKKCELNKEFGSTDLRYFSAKGVPAVIFGPVGENIHADDEYVYIDSIEMFYRIMSEFIEKNINY
ncbi:M20/M25/M40 family metallo-hydrolase [Candidatus Woesearchaeota archaeon]|nr:M20/M25/M40 family metallo-hydrolase [Candidatus Woesearchaeota archaeon]